MLAAELKTPGPSAWTDRSFHAARKALDHAKRKGKSITAAETRGIMERATDIWDLAVPRSPPVAPRPSAA